MIERVYNYKLMTNEYVVIRQSGYRSVFSTLVEAQAFLRQFGK